MPPINRPIDSEVRIVNLERAIEELRAGTITTKAGSVTLPPGTNLNVIATDGTLLARIGYLGGSGPDGKPEQGFVFRRDNGGTAISVQGGDDPVNNYRQFVALWDDSRAAGDTTNRVIVSSDAVSGTGLATPYVPIGLAAAYDGAPQINSTDWSDLAVGTFYRQHPKALVRVRVSADASDTTGEVRVLLDGKPVDGLATAAVRYVIEEKNFGPFAVPGKHMSSHTINVQARRTAGTGHIKGAPYAMGVQS